MRAHTHTHTHTYTYRYMCVCVCVYVCVDNREEFICFPCIDSKMEQPILQFILTRIKGMF